MKKSIAVLLCLLLALSVCLPALAVNEDVEGELLIYTSMYKEVLPMINEALQAEFPNLKPGSDSGFFFQGGSNDLISKIYGEMGDDKKGTLGADMIMVAEPSFALELKDYGYLQPYELEDAENKLRFPYDKDGYWYPVRVCNMVLATNPEAADYWAKLGVNVPASYKDFAYDPTLKGCISMGDPMKSGTSYAAIISLMDKYGEEYLDKLAANSVERASGSAAIAKLQGEGGVYATAALMILEESILNYVGKEADEGRQVTNLKICYPEDGVILIPSPVMIVAENRSPNCNIEAAEAVAKWFLSPEGQRLILKANMHGVLKDLDEYPEGSVSTDELVQKDLGVDWEKAYHEREQIKKLWSEKVTQ